jgi:hypothetical protein
VVVNNSIHSSNNTVEILSHRTLIVIKIKIKVTNKDTNQGSNTIPINNSITITRITIRGDKDNPDIIPINSSTMVIATKDKVGLNIVLTNNKVDNNTTINKDPNSHNSNSPIINNLDNSNFNRTDNIMDNNHP